MKKIQLAAAAALALAAGLSFADTPSNTTRDERMDAALQDYRSQQSDAADKNAQPGPMARAEESIKRGARKTGEAIKHGAQKTGQAVGKGVRKTGEALQRGGNKLEEKSSGAGTDAQ